MESEADELGAVLMVLAGYDPRVAAQVFGALQSLPKHLEFMSTHPHSKSRATALEATVARLGATPKDIRVNVFAMADVERRRRMGAPLPTPR